MLTAAIPYLAVSAGLIIVLLLWRQQDAAARRRLRLGLEEAWGRMPDDAPTPEAMTSIASYFRNCQRLAPSRFPIDDLTWADLELDEVFLRLNATTTTVGEEVLYRWLREPSCDAGTLARRRRLIETFQANPAPRLAVQLILARLGKRRFVDVTDYLVGECPPAAGRARRYIWLAGAALASPLALLADPLLGALLVIATFVINTVVYYRRRTEIAADLERLSQVVRVVKCGHALAAAGIGGLEPERATLAACVDDLGGIERRSFYVSLQRTGGLADVVGEYIRIVLLKELIDYEYLRRDVIAHRARLLELYDTLGAIDAALAIGSFRDNLPFWTTPDINRTVRRGFVGFDDLYHPMIDDPAPNSRELTRPLLVTGSNASGKSFLKAVAINAILAQSTATACARRFALSNLRVLTSMALSDSVLSGESYFTAELKSVRRLLDDALDDEPCLCVVDEVLRGTNTVERIAAASAILGELASRGRLSLAATHDGEIVTLLDGVYDNVHFAEEVTADGVSFSYRLAEGPATSRNAIRLLGVLGYPPGIVEQAEASVRRFLADGRWTPRRT